ncbi:TPA: hypothetical protein ACH1PF_002467 [Enterobacter cloacae]
MKLIDFLISENKKGWEWPDSIVNATSTKGGRSVNFYFDYACHPSLSNTLIAPTPFSSSELVSREQYEAALAASKPEWDGDGLPPVGCRIEYTCKQPDAGHPAVEAGKWYGGTIIAYYGEGVWTSDNGIRHLSNTIFRPIRSEEYNKRYAAIEAIFEILDAGVSTSQDSIDIYDAIAAGKIPHIRID